MTEQTNNQSQFNYLRGDLKKILIICLIIIAVLVIITIVDHQTNFLANFAQSAIKKLIGQ